MTCFHFTPRLIPTKARHVEAQKRRVACLTFSRFKKGIAKRPTENMTRRHATWIDHVAQPSYSAFCLEIGDFFLKRHTLLRTLTGVATRPWRTPRLACRRSRAVMRPGVWERSTVPQSPARRQNYTTLIAMLSNRRILKINHHDAQVRETDAQVRVRRLESNRVDVGSHRVDAQVRVDDAQVRTGSYLRARVQHSMAQSPR